MKTKIYLIISFILFITLYVGVMMCKSTMGGDYIPEPNYQIAMQLILVNSGVAAIVGFYRLSK